MRRSRYQRSVGMRYNPDSFDALFPIIGVNPSRISALPTTQKPVMAVTIDAIPVAITNTTKSGLTQSASAVPARRTPPAMSQTVLSMYHRFVGTM